MTQAVTHILVPIILLSLFRDIFFKTKSQKEKFPLHYVLIGGLAGLLPDLDVAVYYLLSFFGFSISEIHRTFSHNLFIVLIFIFLSFLFIKFKNKGLGRHHLKLPIIFFLIAFGIFIHLVLDMLLAGRIIPFFPWSNYAIGLNLINYFPVAWRGSIIPSLDAVFLVFWLIYMEIKHRITDFI